MTDGFLSPYGRRVWLGSKLTTKARDARVQETTHVLSSGFFSFFSFCRINFLQIASAKTQQTNHYYRYRCCCCFCNKSQAVYIKKWDEEKRNYIYFICDYYSLPGVPFVVPIPGADDFFSSVIKYTLTQRYILQLDKTLIC